MKRYTGTVWLRGAVILSVILIGTSMGGSLQTASAAGNPIDKLQSQIDALNTKVQDNSLLVVHARSIDYVVQNGTTDLVPLTDPAGTDPALLQSTTFNAIGDLTVTYTAECAVSAAAGSTSTWLTINIELVDIATNVVTALAPSSGTDDAFCTSNGTAEADGWVMASITGIATNLPRANYAAQIRSSILNGVAGNFGRLDDSTLVVRK
jgi:hypothetical protein